MSATTPIFSFTQPTVGGDNGVWGGFLNTDWANLDTYLGILRQAAKVLTIGATTTLDFNSPASVFKLTVTQATTIAIANTPANITTQQLSTQFTLLVVNGGSFAVTWPASFVWSGGSVPTLQVSGTDVIVGWSPDNGTTWNVGMLSTIGKSALSKLGQVGNQAVTGAEVSVGTVVVPAGKLATGGDIIRIIITGRFQATSPSLSTATMKVKFGATTLSFGFNLNSAATSPGAAWDIILTITRQSGVAQLMTGRLTDTLGNVLVSAAPAETLANAITIDFRPSTSDGASTLFVDAAIVEAATQ